MGLRRRNKKEREGQLALHFAAETATERYVDRRAHQMAALADQPEDAVAQVADKEDAYAHYLRSNEYQAARWEADTWTAAFFWPIPPGDPATLLAPTQEALQAARQGRLQQHPTLLKEVQCIASHQQFFHWTLHFPEVFHRPEGGFDLILMNPLGSGSNSRKKNGLPPAARKLRRPPTPQRANA
jgi:hypothetical protein